MATYYVDSASSSDANAGTSPSAPWAHCPGMRLWTGSATLAAGDTVYFNMDGLWSFTDTTDFMAALKIRGGVSYIGDVWARDGVANYPRARFECTDRANDPGSFFFGFIAFNGGDTGWDYAASDHATIETIFKGFDLDGNDEYLGGIYFNYQEYDPGAGPTRHLTGATKRVENCLIHHFMANQGAAADYYRYQYSLLMRGTSIGVVANVEIIDTVVHSCGRDGICCYPGEETTNDRNENVLVRGCEVYNTGRDPNYGAGSGLVAKGYNKDVVFEYNYVHDTIGAGVFLNTNEATAYTYSPRNVHIRHNILVGSGSNINGGIRFYTEVAGSDTWEVYIYGNILINWQGEMGDAGGGIKSEDQGTSSKHYYYIYNNTLINSPAQFQETGTAFKALEFKNNIVYTTNSDIPLAATASAFLAAGDHSNNTFYKASGTLVAIGATNYTAANLTTWEATALSSNPLFTNVASLPTGFTGTYGTTKTPNTTGLSLQVTSPALNAGAALAAAYTSSINTVTRPSGTAWDRGAYEYNEGGSPPPVGTPVLSVR